MPDKWDDLKQPLWRIYQEKAIPRDCFERDAEKLADSFRKTEKMWEEQLRTFEELEKKIRFVLLGEAPLGADKYFYNERSPLTSFFRHEISPKVEKTSKPKKDLLTHLREYGFVILDLFPYSLNSSTQLVYGKPKPASSQRRLTQRDCRTLFHESFEVHLKPKLERIQKLKGRQITFCLRYRTHQFLLPCLKERLSCMGFADSFSEIACVGSSNMPMDKEELSKILKGLAAPDTLLSPWSG